MKSCRTDCGLNDAQAAPATAATKDNHISSTFIINEMDCPTEEQMIRSKLDSLADISAVEFNLMRRQLTVSHTEHAFDTLLKALQSLGFNPELQQGEHSSVRPSSSQLAAGGCWYCRHWRRNTRMDTLWLTLGRDLAHLSGAGHGWFARIEKRLDSHS